MDSYLAGVKTRLFGRVATILVAFLFSVAFILALMRITPGTGLPEVVNAGNNGADGGVSPIVGTGTSLQTCRGGHKGSVDILSKAESKYNGLSEDKFTIAMLTYKRPKELNETLTILLTPKIPSLEEIVVVWNNLGEAPPADFVSGHGVPVRYRRSPVNSLNQKLYPDPSYKTKAILLSDDDVYYHPDDLEFVFQTWRKFSQNRLTGALARCADYNNKDGKWKYGFCSKKDDEDVYSMIITNLSFAHISFLDYYSSADPKMTQLRQYVDDHLNCEDIAMNYVASMLTCSGPMLVRGRKPYFNYEPGDGISRRPGHLENRSKCLNEFTGIFGFMPLVNETSHIERGVIVSNV